MTSPLRFSMRALACICAFGLNAALETPAFADDDPPARDVETRGCSCLGVLKGDEAGVFLSVNGEVFSLGVEGLAPAKAGDHISLGTRVTVGSVGGATLLFSRWCKVWLDPNTDADVSLAKRQLCVRATKSDAIPDHAVALGGDPLSPYGGLGSAAGDSSSGLAAGLGTVALGALGVVGASKLGSISP